MSARTHYPEEFQPPPSKALAIFCGGFLSVCLLGVGAWFGTLLCEPCMTVAPLNVRPTVANPPPPVFPCKTRDEWGRICRARTKSTRTGI
jgi:hypothetical protein